MQNLRNSTTIIIKEKEYKISLQDVHTIFNKIQKESL